MWVEAVSALGALAGPDGGAPDGPVSSGGVVFGDFSPASKSSSTATPNVAQMVMVAAVGVMLLVALKIWKKGR